MVCCTFSITNNTHTHELFQENPSPACISRWSWLLRAQRASAFLAQLDVQQAATCSMSTSAGSNDTGLTILPTHCETIYCQCDWRCCKNSGAVGAWRNSPEWMMMATTSRQSAAVKTWGHLMIQLWLTFTRDYMCWGGGLVSAVTSEPLLGNCEKKLPTLCLHHLDTTTLEHLFFFLHHVVSLLLLLRVIYCAAIQGFGVFLSLVEKIEWRIKEASFIFSGSWMC